MMPLRSVMMMLSAVCSTAFCRIWIWVLPSFFSVMSWKTTTLPRISPPSSRRGLACTESQSPEGQCSLRMKISVSATVSPASARASGSSSRRWGVTPSGR